VAQAADRLEQAAGDESLEAFKAAVAELETASREARAAIRARLADRYEGAGAMSPVRRGRGD
jgi:class 3 adenylate cyclase